MEPRYLYQIFIRSDYSYEWQPSKLLCYITDDANRALRAFADRSHWRQYMEMIQINLEDMTMKTVKVEDNRG